MVIENGLMHCSCFHEPRGDHGLEDLEWYSRGLGGDSVSHLEWRPDIKAWMEIFEIQGKAQKAGYWMELRSSFAPNNGSPNWTAGFTLHNCSGWNGFPDYQGHGDVPLAAVRIAWEELQKAIELEKESDGQ